MQSLVFNLDKGYIHCYIKFQGFYRTFCYYAILAWTKTQQHLDAL